MRIVIFLLSILVCLVPMTFADSSSKQNFKEMWEIVAGSEGLSKNEECLWQLATESEFKAHYISTERMSFYVVTPHYRGEGGFDDLRGMQGNGNFYVFDSKLNIVGQLEGNSFAITITDNGKMAIRTTWHMSASDNSPRLYVWNGERFEKTTEK